MGIFDKDPAYQRLKELRESGYKGPVDQHGNADRSGKYASIFKALDEATDRSIKRGQK